MCIIYIVVIPHLSRVPQLRRSIKSHNPLCVCLRNTPRGERVDMGWFYCLIEIRQFKNSQHLSHFTTRGIDTSLSRQIPHDVISPSLGSLSVCLSMFLLFASQRELPRACTHTETYVGDTWIFISVSPCPVARKYFLGSPLIYHNRRLSTRSKLWTPGQSRSSRAVEARDRARPQSINALNLIANYIFTLENL